MVNIITRTLEVNKVDILKLSDIDYMNHKFAAQIFCAFVIRGGGDDPDLSNHSKEFPFGPDGKPTFRPSAAWFMEQFEVCNAITVKIVDSKVFAKDGDLLMQIRYEGVFRETMELYDFPLDTQGLGIHLSCNCRSTGMTPVTFSLGKEVSNAWKLGTIDLDGFTMAALYNLRPTLLIYTHMVGSEADRLFPTISMTALVHRRALFFTINAGVPFALFSLLSVLQFAAMPVRDGEKDWGSINHRAQLSLMMVLTVSAYKMAVGGKLPALSYFTLMDKYMLLSGAYVIGVAVYCRCTNWAAKSITADEMETLDHIFAVVFASVLVLIHILFGRRVFYLHLAGRPREDPLNDILDKEQLASRGTIFTAVEAAGTRVMHNVEETVGQVSSA